MKIEIKARNMKIMSKPSLPRTHAKKSCKIYEKKLKAPF